MLTIEEMREMTYQGRHLVEHQEAQYHNLDKELIYDLLCLAETISKKTDNPSAVLVAHIYKIGKIAGIKQERKRRKRRANHE